MEDHEDPIVWGESIHFIDETQEIILEYNSPTHSLTDREKVDCPIEYFKRKLMGK